MTQDNIWTDLDNYFNANLLVEDPVLDLVLRQSETAGLPSIHVTRNQGAFLHLLARLTSAKRILELGTLGGYSTVCLARALPAGGHLVSLELNPDYAALAQSHLELAGVADRAEIRIGRAVDSMDAMIAAGEEPFDFVFIDADKPSNSTYLERALNLTHPGSMIIIDNVVRGGRVLDPGSSDGNVAGVRAVVEMIANEPRITTTHLQTVGEKGHDGFIIGIVN